MQWEGPMLASKHSAHAMHMQIGRWLWISSKEEEKTDGGSSKGTEITNANFLRSHVGMHSPPHSESETPAKKKKRPAHEQKRNIL